MYKIIQKEDGFQVQKLYINLGFGVSGPVFLPEYKTIKTFKSLKKAKSFKFTLTLKEGIER